MSNCILVVDADRATRELVQFCLEAAGLRVVTAESAVAALAQVEKEHPALVITEAQLPGTSGLELCQQLRDLGQRVLFLSAKTKPQDEEAGLAAGAERYWAKPFLGSRLAAAISELLQTGPAAS